jgi:hypothetical protein
MGKKMKRLRGPTRDLLFLAYVNSGGGNKNESGLSFRDVRIFGWLEGGLI